MISYSRSEYIPELKNMWHRVFGDSQSYLNAFFDKVYEDQNTLVYVENEKVVSVLFMIPYRFTNKGIEQQIVYLYALATDPAFRGRKIMSKLIEKSIEISTERGYALSVLIPAEETLFTYYRQFGFEACFEQVKVTKTLEDIRKELAENAFSIQEMSHRKMELIRADAGQIYAAYMQGSIFTPEGIVLSEEQNRFYIEELEKEGGQAYIFPMSDHRMGYVLLQLIGDSLHIYETNIDSDNLLFLYEILTRQFQFQKIIFYQPVCFDEKETRCGRRKFAMALSLNGLQVEEPFINRVFM